MALDLPIVPVPTVEALAYQLWGSRDLVCPVMDARRGQAYTGIYRMTDQGLETLLSQCAIAVEGTSGKGQ